MQNSLLKLFRTYNFEFISVALFQAFNIFLSIAHYILIARFLGPSLYGAYSTVLSLGRAASPFHIYGRSELILKEANNNDPMKYSREKLYAAIVGTIILSLVLSPIGYYLVKKEVSITTIIYILCGEVFFINLFAIIRGYLLCTNKPIGSAFCNLFVQSS